MKRYNPKDIEPKWQKYWVASSTYTANLSSDKPKFIAMSMFNYPSGAGIHLGHALNYTISDVKARFKRQQGFESYHPVGWDSFGLPAENYAIKAGVSPQVSMATIIPSYHKQYKAMGWSNDWEKEIATHRPEYYKWTQWIFTQMHKNGLAYQDARSQWWCNSCQTVLANEQIIDGKCWRHDSSDDPIVEKKEVKQWFFKITEYADELLDAIDDLDWTESVKIAQKNWIGKSSGAEITFSVAGSTESIKVFTTRPDTIFGATFMVVAPESSLLESIVTEEFKDEVNDYKRKASLKSEVERQANKEKTGVFTGSYAINPANNEEVPIWVADYVLEGYGTGAIMAVPAHDERDHAFANKYNLDIRRVVNNEESYEVCTTKPGELINSGDFNGQKSIDAIKNITSWLEKLNKAKEKVNYKMRDWSVTRQRYWGAPTPIIHCNDCGPVLVPDHDLPVILPELEDFAPSGDGRSALARAKDWLKADCPNCGKEGERETDTLDTYICSSWYMLRYFDPINQEKAFESSIANKWMPIDFYNGGDHATAHLLYARFVTRFFTKIGLLNNPEPFKQMLYNGKVTASDGTMFSKSKGNGVDPLEIIDSGYGADALRVYLMFASPLELWTKWDPQGVPGTYRFLTRLWNLVQEYIETEQGELSEKVENELNRVTHKMIKKVTDDLENNLYNTAISATMAGLNDLYKQKSIEFVKSNTWQESLESIVMLVAPFAPHIAEELWQDLGHSDTVNVEHWPELNEKYLMSDEIKLAIQVNGKVRAEILVSSEASQDEIEKTALAQENVVSHLEGKEPKKIIYVKNRLVSIVV
jgi:leucyl-tRNA synthetase